MNQQGIKSQLQIIEGTTSDPPYFYQLHRMIDAAGRMGGPPAIHWTPHGNGFIIRDKEDLVQNVIPSFFPNIGKADSFSRQLNRNGILKIRKGPNKGCWQQKDGVFFRGSHAELPNNHNEVNHERNGLGQA